MWERTAACALAVGAIPPVNLRVLAKRRSFPDAIDTFFSDAEYESQELISRAQSSVERLLHEYGSRLWMGKVRLREMPNARTAEVALAYRRSRSLATPHGDEPVLALHGGTLAVAQGRRHSRFSHRCSNSVFDMIPSDRRRVKRASPAFRSSKWRGHPSGMTRSGQLERWMNSVGE